MNSFSDSDIIEGMLSEDDRLVSESLKRLYKTCGQMITQIVCTNGGNLHDAEDLVQEVLLTFRSQLLSGKFVHQENVRLSTYIYRMAMNQWITILSRRNADTRRIAEFFVRTEVTDPDPHMVFLDSEETNTFRAVFSKLSPIEQELLRQYYDSKEPLEKIAAQLNMKSTDAAKMMKHRTMLKLRGLIKKYLGTI
ncbi:sigma-70 family RNA polymerase sigma factor [Ravibacter arvi]